MGSNNNFKMRLLQASVLAVLILTALYVSRTPVPAQKGGGQIRSRTTSRIKHVARVMYPPAQPALDLWDLRAVSHDNCSRAAALMRTASISYV